PNGVKVFLNKMKQERKDLRILCGKRIAVIGPGTAAVLEEIGIYVDYMPEIYDAAHLAEGLT
ncbi:MAG: uroporphyrinogen-III synthase, partial [Lachnospiraceae bacterium]|nr:uroporphyrinogen-III synthase [Lachnospiraceae bacterium]